MIFVSKFCSIDIVRRFEWWERSKGSGQRGGKPVDEKPGLRGQPDELGTQRGGERDGRPFSNSEVGRLLSPQILPQADECQAGRGGEGDLQEEKEHRTCYGLFILCSRRGCR